MTGSSCRSILAPTATTTRICSNSSAATWVATSRAGWTMSSALKPLLDAVGNEPGFTVIAFTLDETVYSRELAPLAGHYPALKLGPGWWFLDAPEAMLRPRADHRDGRLLQHRRLNDDTRAYLSIPARHDVARRMDCHYLAKLVAEHRLDEDEAVNSPMTSPIAWPRRPTSCDRRLLRALVPEEAAPAAVSKGASGGSGTT